MEFNGIEKNRWCTDLPCLIIYFAFIGCMGFATFYGYKNGELNKLTAPIDGANQFCGFGENKDYPKMILTSFDITKTIGILKSGVCLKKCPTEKEQDLVDCKDNANYKCGDHKSYKTKDVFDFCLPTAKEDLPEGDQEGFDYL